jgi:hypothetical protein
MPHGGYHGTLAVNPGTTLAVGQGSGLTTGPGRDDKIIGGQSVLTNQGIQNVSPAPSAAEATAAAKAKEADIAKRFPLQTGKIDRIVSDIPGFDADDAKALQMQFQRENQILNNLLIQEQQAKNREGIIRAAQQGQLRKADLTGFEGGLLGLNAFATPSEGISGIRTVRNPFTGEPLAGTTGVAGEALPTQIKAREGLTTPQYNQFIADLYDANPELFEETFPVASGKALTPLIARILEGGLMKDAGRLAGNVREGIGSFVDTITGGRFTPRGGTVRPSDVGTGDIGFGIGSPEIAPKMQTPLFANVPDQFREGFLKFYNEYEGPKAGGMAITPVRLPDGSVIEFSDTGTAAIFREYLKSIGVDSNLQNQTFKIVEDTPQPTGISGFDVDKFYASLPQFQQSYSQQGVSPSLLQFLETAQRFPTV